MSKLEELIQLFRESDISVSDFGANCVGSKNIEEHNLPNWTEVESRTTIDGDWHSVKYFKEIDLYVKVTGYYSSYSGVNIDGWHRVREVKPIEKIITVYE